MKRESLCCIFSTVCPSIWISTVSPNIIEQRKPFRFIIKSVWSNKKFLFKKTSSDKITWYKIFCIKIDQEKSMSEHWGKQYYSTLAWTLLRKPHNTTTFNISYSTIFFFIQTSLHKQLTHMLAFCKQSSCQSSSVLLIGDIFFLFIYCFWIPEIIIIQ